MDPEDRLITGFHCIYNFITEFLKPHQKLIYKTGLSKWMKDCMKEEKMDLHVSVSLFSSKNIKPLRWKNCIKNHFRDTCLSTFKMGIFKVISSKVIPCCQKVGKN